MKLLYGRKLQNRVFKLGDKVLVVLPVKETMLQAIYHGSLHVIKRVETLIVLENTCRR